MSRNSGCNGKVIWGIIVISGNLLIVTGTIFNSLSDDLIAWVVCIVAVIYDIYFIYSRMNTNKNSQNSNNVRHNSPAPDVSERQVYKERAHSETVEPTHSDNPDNKKLIGLKNRYSIPTLPNQLSISDLYQGERHTYQCFEVNQALRRMIKKQSENRNNLKNLRKEINDILDCPGCSSNREKISYINCHKEILDGKKDEYLALYNKTGNSRIQLLDREIGAFVQFRGALAEFMNSKRIVSDNAIQIPDFIKLYSTIPGDLFCSDQTPIGLNYGKNYYCLLPDVILVYGDKNKFITALEPMVMNIEFREKKKQVYRRKKNSGKWEYMDSIISSDSILVSEGDVRSSWLHSRRDGGPDLRYSNNYRIETRTDTFAYTEMTIQIGECRVSFSASRGGLSQKLKQMVRLYCSISHEANYTPSLLHLLESISENSTAALNLTKEYEDTCDRVLCREVIL